MHADTKQLKRYLLGDLPESEADAIDLQIITDENLCEDISLAESNLIEDFLEGALSADEERLFRTNFMTSDARREQLREIDLIKKVARSQAAQKKQPIANGLGPKVQAFFKALSWPVPIAISLLILIGVFAIWFLYLRSSLTSDAMLVLNKAYSQERPLESRITDFNYAPFSNVRSQKNSNVDVKERDRAELMLRNDEAEKPSKEVLHTLGRLFLSKKQFDEAIAELEKASQAGPNDAKVLNDLGVAYLEKYKSQANTESAEKSELPLRALDRFDKAVATSPRLIAVYFNRAECLEILNLPNQAREAWQKYLELDSSSPWASEANVHIQQLDSKSSNDLSGDEREEAFIRAVRADDKDQAFALASQNRELIRENYLPQKLVISLVKADPAEREIKLAFLKYLGGLEKERIGDSYASDLAIFYSNLPTQRLQILRDAESAVLIGYKLCLAEDKFSEAMDQFSNARSLFFKVNDVIEADTICKYFIAYCLYNLDRRSEANALLKEVGNFCDKKEYRWFALMNYYWWLGSQESLGYRTFTETRQNYESSSQNAQNMGDLYMTQTFLRSLILKSNFLGQEIKTIDYSQKLLAVSNQPHLSVRQKLRNLNQIIAANAQTRFPSFSKALVLESVSMATNITDPAFVINAELNAGKVHTQTEDYQEAESWLTKAKYDSEMLPEESWRKRIMAEVLLSLGQLELRRGNSLQAKNYFDAALGFSGELKTKFLVYETHKSRLKALQSLNDNVELNTEIPLTISLAEDYRKTLLNERDRNSFFNNEQEVYDTAVDAAFNENDYQKAYDLAETPNARSLLDLLEKGAKVSNQNSRTEILFDEQTATPLNLTEIQDRMPPAAQILQYRVLSDHVLIWLISRDQFLTFSSTIDAVDLEKKVKHYYELLQLRNPASQEELNRISLDLYTLLLKPARPFLSDSKEVCIVPNRILFYLPFASLTSPEKKYFLEEFTLLYAPSANLFIRSTEIANAKSDTTHERLLSVGNPKFDGDEFPNLADLPDSREEAADIASNYPESKVLYGKAATKAAFEENYKDYEIIHFAGHYLIEPKSSLASKLVMAKSSDNVDDNVLTNGELIGEKLTNAKLVVLAACQTGIEGNYDEKGLAGLSRTFLAAGVPLVVASQWQVDSEATRVLMQKFHRYRTQEKLSTARSLQRAQTDMATDPASNYRQPYFWAAFAAFGGYANF